MRSKSCASCYVVTTTYDRLTHDVRIEINEPIISYQIMLTVEDGSRGAQVRLQNTLFSFSLHESLEKSFVTTTLSAYLPTLHRSRLFPFPIMSRFPELQKSKSHNPSPSNDLNLPPKDWSYPSTANDHGQYYRDSP